MPRLPSVCPGLRAVWVRMSSPRTAPCRQSAPAHSTRSRPSTSTCSSTPSTPPQTPPPSSPPQAALLDTGRPATTEPPPPPTTLTTTTAPCPITDRPHRLRPAPTEARCPDQSATPSYHKLRHRFRPTASLSWRLLRALHHYPPPLWLPLTSPAWAACPSWCLHRTRPGLWSNSRRSHGLWALNRNTYSKY